MTQNYPDGTFSALYGGYLELERYSSSVDLIKAQNTPLTAQKVLATGHFIPQLPVNLNTPYSFLVWTADNVVRFDLIKSMALKIYGKGGFTPFLVQSNLNAKMWDAVAEIDLWQMDSPNKDSIKTAVKTAIVDALYPQPLSLVLKDFPEYSKISCDFNDEVQGALCLDLTKLKIYNFPISKQEKNIDLLRNLSKNQNALIENNNLNFDEIPEYIKYGIKKVREDIAIMDELSSLISMSKFVLQINTCTSKTLWCTSPVLDLLKKLLINKVFVNGRDLFSEFSTVPDYVGKLKNDLWNKYLSTLQFQTNLVRWVIKNKPNHLYLHTHLEERYLGLPVNKLDQLGWGFRKIDKNLSSFFQVFPIASNSKLLKSRGDIGSLLSIDGVYPIGVLSGISNQESGGAVLRPLPQPTGDISEAGGSLDAAADKPSGNRGC